MFGMPRFDASFGGFTGAISSDYDAYFDSDCDDEEDSDDDDDDEYEVPNYDRYEDEPSEEEEYNKYKPRRRVKTRVTCKLSFIFNVLLVEFQVTTSFLWQGWRRIMGKA